MRLKSCIGTLAMLAALAPGSPAFAEQGKGRSTAGEQLQLAEAAPRGSTVRASRIGRLGFAHPPVRSTDQDLSALVQYIADGIGRYCTAVEVFNWDKAEDSSERAQEIFLAFDQALHIKGYDAVKIEVQPPEDPAAQAAFHGVLAYAADSRNVNADDAQMVFLWYFEGDTMHLALCRSEPKKEDADED